MSQNKKTHPSASDPKLIGWIESTRLDFAAAWEAALRGGERPDLEAFAVLSPAAIRDEVRHALEQVELSYRSRSTWLSSGRSGVGVAMPAQPETPAPGPVPGGSDQTMADPARLDPDPEGPASLSDSDVIPRASDLLPTIDDSSRLDLQGSGFLHPGAGEDPGMTREIGPDPRIGPGSGFGSSFGSKSGSGSGSGSSSESELEIAAIQGGEYPVVAGYRIIGELGRGGMGVVYKARQVGLKRMVALKMVLAGAHAGAVQLGRFQLEAEAVARLQHPNIVQIHEIGESGGLPYLSLEFINGGPLDRQIAGKPQPPRDAAQLVETLARAMHFAHGHRIVHRDLKPANILMTEDGVPKITDFGLAKNIEEIDSSQTRSGTIMGTPSYMAPEQARGEIHNIGPHSDLYSLGAILYELVTGRPPFVGATAVDTVVQVMNLEAVPPGQLRPDLPRDLATICMKCLQKDPARRYASCFELAEDLHRFLAGEVIRARPVGYPEMFARWCRRNPGIAGLTAATFLLLVAGVVVSTTAALAIARERNQKEEQRLVAVDARRVADEQRAVAVDARKHADEQVVLALETIKTLIHKIQDQLQNVPRSQQLKQELLQTAVDGLKQVGQKASQSSSSEVAMGLAAAYMKMGLVYRQIGLTEPAFDYVKQCHEINLKQAAALQSDRAKRNLAASFTVLADMSLELPADKDMAATLDYYQKALGLPRRTVPSTPWLTGGTDAPLPRKEVEQGLAETYTRVGVTYVRKGDPAQARAMFLKALALREDLSHSYPDEVEVLQDLARSLYAVGEMSYRMGDDVAGRKHFEDCLKIREKLFLAHPDDAKLRLELARWCGALGDNDIRSRDYAKAEEHYRRGLVLCRELADSDPKNVDHRRDVATAYYQVASAQKLRKELPAAEANFRECLAIRQKMADADPNNVRRRMELIGVLPHCVRAREGGRDRRVSGQGSAQGPGDPGRRRVQLRLVGRGRRRRGAPAEVCRRSDRDAQRGDRPRLPRSVVLQ